jgi:hypothetical protein
VGCKIHITRPDQTRPDLHALNPVGQRMPFVKLLGQSMIVRDFGRQVAEIQVRIMRHCLCRNRDMALGIAVTELVG